MKRFMSALRMYAFKLKYGSKKAVTKYECVDLNYLLIDKQAFHYKN